MQKKPDIKIDGYHIGRCLGKGSAASVYLGVENKLCRKVAIKVLHPAMQVDCNMKARFLREARFTAGLQHPYIIPILDAGVTTHGMLYLVMPLGTGLSLKSYIRKAGTIRPKHALRILECIAEALHYAHAKDLLHRDVKSANIVLNKDSGYPMLADFGLAKKLNDTDLTQAGSLIGSPNYIAPEQARGVFEPKGDIYGLGIVLYEMLMGSVPFQSESFIEVMIKHATQPLPQLPNDLSIFQPLFEAMCAKKLHHRIDADVVLTMIADLKPRTLHLKKHGHKLTVVADKTVEIEVPDYSKNLKA